MQWLFTVSCQLGIMLIMNLLNYTEFSCRVSNYHNFSNFAGKRTQEIVCVYTCITLMVINFYLIIRHFRIERLSAVVFSAICGILTADFGSGVVHWAADVRRFAWKFSFSFLFSFTDLGVNRTTDLGKSKYLSKNQISCDISILFSELPPTLQRTSHWPDVNHKTWLDRNKRRQFYDRFADSRKTYVDILQLFEGGDSSRISVLRLPFSLFDIRCRHESGKSRTILSFKLFLFQFLNICFSFWFVLFQFLIFLLSISDSSCFRFTSGRTLTLVCPFGFKFFRTITSFCLESIIEFTTCHPMKLTFVLRLAGWIGLLRKSSEFDQFPAFIFIDFHRFFLFTGSGRRWNRWSNSSLVASHAKTTWNGRERFRNKFKLANHFMSNNF